MGVSTNAMLYFGFEIDPDVDDMEEIFPGWEEIGDFDDWVTARAGITDWRKKSDFMKACPAELFDHCHHENRMFVLGPRGAEYTVYRGSTKEITPEMLARPAGTDAFLAWCEENGIKTKEPRWLLCSYWG
jgi:hypothetical protein